ncbi:hypothetical protein Ate01nite_64900 [Actinoplanes teichomyceticus]|nr:hypothetical protein Ate01nite_64900 [Actinoplanes teichomyceticus]
MRPPLLGLYVARHHHGGRTHHGLPRRRPITAGQPVRRRTGHLRAHLRQEPAPSPVRRRAAHRPGPALRLRQRRARPRRREDGQDASGSGPARGEDDWIDRYASYALKEATYEALAWLRVDGQPWLDPHGDAEKEIYALTDDLCARLAVLRRARTPGDREHHGHR